jgi:hypothetical protein
MLPQSFGIGGDAGAVSRRAKTPRNGIYYSASQPASRPSLLVWKFKLGPGSDIPTRIYLLLA